MARHRITAKFVVTVIVDVEDEMCPAGVHLSEHLRENLAGSIESDWPYEEPEQDDLIQAVHSVHVAHGGHWVDFPLEADE